MTIYLTTDTHLGHTRMIEMCNRPEDFSRRILKNIGSIIKHDDILIHLGDVCIGRESFWNTLLRESCAGKMWLIKGNHDKRSTTWYLRHGWDAVCDSMTIEMFGRRIVLSHRPLYVQEDEINIHGHGHINSHHPELETNSRNKLFFIEHDYVPVTLKSIVGM